MSFFAKVRAVIALVLAVLLAQCGLDDLLSDTIPEPDSGVSAEELAMIVGGEPNPLTALRDDLASDLVFDRLDLSMSRAYLMRHRLAINAYLIGRVLEVRVPWIDGFERSLRWVGCGLVLILLGPIVLLFRTPPEPSRWRRIVKSTPYFAMAAAASLVIYPFIVGGLAGIQGTQVTLSAAGSPSVATTDAAIHHMVTADDEDLVSLVGRVVEARELASSDPVGAMGLVEHLWTGVQAAQNARILNGAFRIMRSSGWLLDVYLLLFVAASTVLAGVLIAPIILSLARYPAQVVDDRADPRIWRFLVAQLKVIWRETRAFVWLLLLLLLLTAMAVIAVRLLSYPIAVAWLKTILATEALLRTSSSLPEVGILLNAAALTLVVLATTMAFMLPVGIALTKAHLVIRERLRAKRRFREFPAFWGMLRGLHRKVVVPVALSATVAFVLYFGATFLTSSPSLVIWLPQIVVAPVFGVLVWRLRVVGRLVQLARVDALDQ